MIPQEEGPFREWLIKLLETDPELSRAVHGRSDVNVDDEFSQHHLLSEIKNLIKPSTAPAGLWTPTGTIIFPVPLVNQTSDGNVLPATSSTSPIYTKGVHDVRLAHVGGFLNVIYQDSGEECFYETTEQLMFESDGAVAGDVYDVITYNVANMSYWNSGDAGHTYTFSTGAAGHERFAWSDERSNRFYLPGGGGYTLTMEGAWSVDCNASAARVVTSPGCWVMATRYVLN